MVTGVEPVRIISFLLLAACAAFCQSLPSADQLQRVPSDAPAPPEIQRQEVRSWGSLPDAPSPVQSATQTGISGQDASSPLTAGALNTGAIRQAEVGAVAPGGPLSFTATHPPLDTQKESGNFWGKYLYSPPLKQDTPYDSAASASGGLMGRVSYAASRIILTRDASGKDRLNTTFFLRAFTAVAMHAASRTYGVQTAASTFNNFGVSIGGDAGMHVYNEFRPDIRHIMKGVNSKFTRSHEGSTHDQSRGDSFPAPAR
jgi:hypothetical protein